MNIREELETILNNADQIALATCVENVSDVRIVNFYYEDGIMYFATFKDAGKIKGFEANPNVSFTTIPKGSVAHVRSKGATVKRSQKSIYDMAEEFSNKIDGYENNIKFNGDNLVLFEIIFHEARVIVDMNTNETITI